jgi:hypothetical protein
MSGKRFCFQKYVQGKVVQKKLRHARFEQAKLFKPKILTQKTNMV